MEGVNALPQGNKCDMSQVRLNWVNLGCVF